MRANEPTTATEQLDVFDVLSNPWDLLGTVVRTGGKVGTITCKPKNLEQLHRRPMLLKQDPIDFLSGRTEPSRLGRGAKPPER